MMHSRKTNTSEPLSISVSYLSRNNMLSSGYVGVLSWSRHGIKTGSINYSCMGDVVRFAYRVTDTATHQQAMRNCSIKIARLACHFGGYRPWFVCPHVGCGRRVGSLYLVGGSFLCRHCHQLGYASQQVGLMYRLIMKADKVRDRLKWEAGILNGEGVKPKGMHWRTYWRLVERHGQLMPPIQNSIRRKFG